ncbi:cycloartenol-C-24-methyltransferase-like isoform X1 [Neltuma alba]|uniref:cycloartenol-C-24-methyltransferase-like isoform X1 n=1 Tax=Neltuma alba TaxID=207710 RepID=UPI0010A509E7|nr:cycloartenol-C-24-methyltransferase-like isoform X1 [Prosopis alba]XP_028783813.1 cycloartenol-C-24-methyltransferase-like isoform X1 [Prosopis alba]
MSKAQAASAVEKYQKYSGSSGGEGEEERKSNYYDKSNTYYDVVTGAYEAYWGESLHFASRWKGETLRESIKRHEHFIAMQLGLKPGQKVLDVGCGVGGPAIEISRFSKTSVTGLNNNEYQINRAKELSRLHGTDQICDFVQGDFMNIPFPDNTFDAVYAIEATVHSPDAYECYKEIYRVLKPGQCFAAYESSMTTSFDPTNPEHQRIKKELLLGGGLVDIRSTTKVLEALKQAGFEVMWSKNIAEDSPIPWYFPIDKSNNSLSTNAVRLFKRNMVKALEFVGLAPKGIIKVQDFAEWAADGLVEGGKKEIFTPMFFFLAKKPAD